MSARASRGSIAVESVILAPVLFALVLLTVHAHRQTDAAARVQRAADVAARIASQSASATMIDNGMRAARRDLSDARDICRSVSVHVSVGRIGRHATVTANVRCTPRVRDLRFLRLGSKAISRSSTEVIDYYTSR